MRTRLGTILVVALLLAAALVVANSPIDAGLVTPSAGPGATSSAVVEHPTFPPAANH